MGASFFYKLFLSTIGSMPARYNPEVDSWWGIVLTELGFLDPFREENRSCLVAKLICTLFFALFLSALSLFNLYKKIEKQRDEAREDSRKGAFEWCDLHIKLRDTENELYYANERLQYAYSDMNEERNEERKEFGDTIQGLNDQHLVDREEIGSLKQDVWNAESDRDGYARQVFQVSKENQKLKSDLSEATHQPDLGRTEGQTMQEDLFDASNERDLARAEVPLLQESPDKVTLQCDLAQGEMQIFSIRAEPQQGQVTTVSETLKARPKPDHRRTKPLSSMPKPHKKLFLKRSRSVKQSISSSAGTESPQILMGENLPKSVLQAMLTEKDQEIKDLQERSQTSAVQAGRETEPMLGEKASEPLDLKSSIAVKDLKIRDLEQEKGTLTAQIGELRTDLGNLSEEHGERSRHLHTHLIGKDEKIRILQAEKTAVEERSAETVAALRTKLEEKEKEVADLEEANGNLLAEPAADTVQRLNKLSHELEVSRLAHAQCEENSISHNSRIGQLLTAKEQLEEKLRDKNSEIGSLQRQSTELAGLQEKHAKCAEHANSQDLEITQLRGAKLFLQGANDGLSQELMTTRDGHTSLFREGQREVRSLQGQIEALNHTVHHQQQHIQTLETNCPKCQKLREALDEVVKDVEMSDDNTRAKMEIDIRTEWRSQVADDARRQIRGEVERVVREEFRIHYSDLLTRQTRRIQEQNRLLLEKDANLEKAKNAPTVNHLACEKREGNLQSTISKMQQDAKIAQRQCSRSSIEAKHDREQLNHAQKATERLKGELETMKADQRRAQNVNPLQSKLTACQRESNKMMEDRNKARGNCSSYSKQLSDLRKKYNALEDQVAAFREKGASCDGPDGDSKDDGRIEEPVAEQDEQRKVIDIHRKEVARLSKELEQRKAHDKAQDQAMDVHEAPLDNQSLPPEESAQQRPEGGFPDDQLFMAPAMDGNKAAAPNSLHHAIKARKPRERKNTQPAASGSPTVQSGSGSSQHSAQNSHGEGDDKKSDDELGEGEIVGTKLTPKPARRSRPQPARVFARQPMARPLPGGGAGKKREHDECSDGEADDEGDDERKKVKVSMIEDGMRRLKASGDSPASAQGTKTQEGKNTE